MMSRCKCQVEEHEPLTEDNHLAEQMDHEDPRLRKRIDKLEADIRELEEEVVKLKRSKQQAAPGSEH